MSNVLLRVLRFRASVLLPSAEDFFRHEMISRKTAAFEDDLSIFEVTDSEVIQAHAEFLGNGLTPRNNERRGGVDLQGVELPSLAATKGLSKWFKFFRDRHRSVALFDEEEALELARSLFINIATREKSADEADVRAYVKERLAGLDPEWVGCLNDPDPKSEAKCKGWKKWLARNPPEAKPSPLATTRGQSSAAASNGAVFQTAPDPEPTKDEEVAPPPSIRPKPNNNEADTDIDPR